jgi:hypothetical protein
MRRVLIVALTFGVLAPGPRAAEQRAGAPAAAASAAVVVPKGAEEVWQLDEKRRAALVAGDVATLEALFSDEMTYSHTNGLVDTKQSYLKSLRSGVRYEKMDVSDVKIARYDSTVVITGLAHIAVKSPNGPIGFKARFTGVWARQQDQWRFVAWQTTRMPE